MCYATGEEHYELLSIASQRGITVKTLLGEWMRRALADTLKRRRRRRPMLALVPTDPRQMHISELTDADDDQ